MKKTLINLCALSSIAVATSCSDQQSTSQQSKSIVIYYSQTHATEQVANIIAKSVCADIDSVVAEQPYSGTFDETVSRCKNELDNGVFPAIKPTGKDIANYDTIYVGFPVWCGVAAPPMRTWVKNADLSNKVVIPFCTFGSGGLESSVIDFENNLTQNVSFNEGYGVRNARLAKAEEEVEEFLIRNGIKTGEAEELDSFSNMETLNDEEKSIFNAACGDYPFPLGTPIGVKSRKTKKGTEYDFITRMDISIPRESEVFVIVSNEEGAKPEFTKVVR